MTSAGFGKRLNKIRKKTGIKTEPLAEKKDVSVGFFNGVFSGKA